MGFGLFSQATSDKQEEMDSGCIMGAFRLDIRKFLYGKGFQSWEQAAKESS